VSAKTIRIGIAVSLSGRYAEQGRQCLEGVRCYVRDANGANGIFLREAGCAVPVELRIYDDESRVGKLRTLTDKLVRQDATDILLGPYGSGLAVAAAEIASANQTVLWNHSGATDRIFAAEHEWVVGICSPASRYFASVLDFVSVVSPGPRTVALFSATTGFAQEVASGARASAARHGFRLIRDESYRSLTRDFRPMLAGLGAEPPEVVLGVGRIEDDLRFARALRRSGLRPKVAALVGAGIERFARELGDAAEGFLAPSQWEPRAHQAVSYGPSTEEFTRRYAEQSPEALDYPAAQAYAGALIAQRCVEVAGSTDQWALRAAASTLRLRTFFGRFAIDRATGKQTGHRMLAIRWQDGRKAIVWPPEPAEASPIDP
jgi:branched-chain amino acid transport system substrate-binding protein